ncbi:tautomerase family protein [Metapseudomonas resinovorans]|uniref:2-hydroxymuconate tautomerase n=1 Tax=Metapseudomonas resinovorans NBRC 106553 TaxID=1245471 RepID=S6ARC6_METRE|nr:tautomerase family protein [Pseudomonas resinovorans]BAN48448.1 putative tautomerase [Pseudomonas resinovorans NBRC 106553]
MPLITVELFPGRTPDKKRELIQALTDTYVEVCGGKPQAVTILLKEVDPADWGVGGKTYADIIAESKAQA